jgi:putative membrane protein
MTLPPGFLDDPPRTPVAHSPPAAPPPPAAPMPPLLLDAEAGAEGRIEPVWEPALIAPPARGLGTLGWLVGGFALLFGAWLVLSAAAFVADQFNRSTGFGLFTLALFAAAFALIVRGLYGEARAYLVLRRVEHLREALGRTDLTLPALHALAEPWFQRVRTRLPDAEEVGARLAAARSVAEARALLDREVAEPLRRQARQAGRRAALEGGAMVAITPSPVLEGLLAGLRGLALIRQVAQLYGLRPGLLATLALLRRVAWTAAGVSGLDLISQSLADHTLHKLPLVRHLAGAVPGTSLAAMRLYRLAAITAEACCPVPR